MANIEKIRKRQKAYTKANTEKKKASSKAYYKANTEKIRKRRNAYNKAIPEAYWDLVGEDVLDDSGALEICHSIIEDFEKTQKLCIFDPELSLYIFYTSRGWGVKDEMCGFLTKRGDKCTPILTHSEKSAFYRKKLSLQEHRCVTILDSKYKNCMFLKHNSMLEW